MDPVITALAAYPGDYQQALISQMYNSLRLEQEGIAVIPGVKSDLNMHKLLVGDGLKPYTGKFVAKDDLAFQPRVLHVEKFQRDMEIEPEKYRTTFMQHMRGKGENANNQTIPFAEFTWNAVLKALGQEINLQTVFGGVGKAAFAAYNAGTVYAVGDLITFTQNNEIRYFKCVTITTAGQSPDTHPAKWAWAGAKAFAKGLGKIIADEITGSALTPVATGAVTAANAYEKFVQLWRAQPEVIKMGLLGQGIIHCSMTDYEFLTDDYENKISKNFETVNGLTYLAKTDGKCRIWPVSWLAGSRRLISTLEGNLVAGTDELSDMNNIRSTPQMYTVNAGITGVLGFQVADLDALKVSDQV